MLQHKFREGQRRAELANRVRTSRGPMAGDLVMLRDPARTKTKIGHRPGKIPAEGPYEVVSAHGSSAKVVHVITKENREGVHAENLIYLRSDVADYERKRAERSADSIVPIADAEPARESFGQLMSRRKVPAVPKAVVPEEAARTRARLRDVAVGRHIAYKGEVAKRCRVGAVTAVDNEARKLVVQVHCAAADGRLRVKWHAAYDSGEGGSPQPRLEEVSFDNVLTVVELRSGVLGHGAARKLDIAGWKLDEGVIRQGAVDVSAVISGDPTEVSLSRLAPLLAACKGNIESQLHFVDDSLQRWAGGGERVIIEVFQGHGFLSAAISAEGLPTAPGFDIIRLSYGQRWDLSDPSAQGRWCWLICEVLVPLGLHFALPCTRWCALGTRSPDDEAWQLADLTMDSLEHQAEHGRLASFEGPRLHGLLTSEKWTSRFGPTFAPTPPWRYASPDGCLCRVVSPDPVDDGRPMQKGYSIVANFDIDRLRIRCREGLVSPSARRSLHFADLLDSSDEELAVAPCPTDQVVASLCPTSQVAEYPCPTVQVVDSGSSAAQWQLPTLQVAGTASATKPPPPCAPAAEAVTAGGGSSFVAAPGETSGVETGAALTPKERARIAQNIQKLKETSDKKWDRCVRSGSFDEVLTPLACYKFVEAGVDVTTDPRRNEGHRAEVLRTLGIEPREKHLAHLADKDIEGSCRLVLEEGRRFPLRPRAAHLPHRLPQRHDYGGAACAGLPHSCSGERSADDAGGDRKGGRGGVLRPRFVAVGVVLLPDPADAWRP